jgi:hypothetical protein
MTSMGIEPTIFRLVAQRLNQLMPHVLLTGANLVGLKNTITVILTHILRMSYGKVSTTLSSVRACQISKLSQKILIFYKTRNWSYWREPNFASSSIHTN